MGEGHTITIPCKVGDRVFGIRRYNGVAHVAAGTVTEMYFTEGMRLCIVVKHVCRGEWMKNIFPTYEAATAFLEGYRRA